MTHREYQDDLLRLRLRPRWPGRSRCRWRLLYGSLSRGERPSTQTEGSDRNREPFVPRYYCPGFPGARRMTTSAASWIAPTATSVALLCHLHNSVPGSPAPAHGVHVVPKRLRPVPLRLRVGLRQSRSITLAARHRLELVDTVHATRQVHAVALRARSHVRGLPAVRTCLGLRWVRSRHQPEVTTKQGPLTPATRVSTLVLPCRPKSYRPVTAEPSSFQPPSPTISDGKWATRST